jgi:hypothetical protein
MRHNKLTLGKEMIFILLCNTKYFYFTPSVASVNRESSLLKVSVRRVKQNKNEIFRK